MKVMLINVTAIDRNGHITILVLYIGIEYQVSLSTLGYAAVDVARGIPYS